MRRFWLALGILFATATAGIAAESAANGRFSRAVEPAERTAAGLDQLNSDQIAVLDALVRRDMAAQTRTNADPKAPADFSERLTANERELTGITLLKGEELARLNQLVARYASAATARSLLGPPTYAPRVSQIEPVERKDRKNLHGTFSLSYGWGSGGYSERSGSMVVNYDDPAGRYSVTIGYRETHVKGGPGYGVYRDGEVLPDGVPYRR